MTRHLTVTESAYFPQHVQECPHCQYLDDAARSRLISESSAVEQMHECYEEYLAEIEAREPDTYYERDGEHFDVREVRD